MLVNNFYLFLGSVDNAKKFVQVSVLSCLDVVVSSIGQFTSPYLKDIISHAVGAADSTAGQLHSQVTEKAHSLLHALATKMECRLLLPALYSSYPIVKNKPAKVPSFLASCFICKSVY